MTEGKEPDEASPPSPLLVKLSNGDVNVDEDQFMESWGFTLDQLYRIAAKFCRGQLVSNSINQSIN